MNQRMVQKSITDFFGKKKSQPDSGSAVSNNKPSIANGDTGHPVFGLDDRSKTPPPLLDQKRYITKKCKKSKSIRDNDVDDDDEVEKNKPKKRKVLRIESDSDEGEGESSDKNEINKTPEKSPINNETTKLELVQNCDKNIVKETRDDKDQVDKGTTPGANKTVKNVESDNFDSFHYNPSVDDYDPITNATWKRDQKVPYLALSKTLFEIENIQSRLKMVEILSNYFRSVMVLSPNDLLPSVYLCLNKIAPAFEGVELGIAETSLFKAIAQSTGRSMTQVKNDVKEVGDIGIIAEQSRSNQKLMFQPPPLTVPSVFQKLKEIAQLSGRMSANKKVDKIRVLYVACKHMEARYLIRSLAGKLRIGLAEQSVLQALALACLQTPPNQDTYPPKVLTTFQNTNSDSYKNKLEKLSTILKNTYYECPNYDLLIPALLKYGVEELPKHCKLVPGCPLKPMLAHPAKGIDEVFQRFEGIKFTCEWKYDGERAQIHAAKDGKVQIFSRNQEETTTKFPDIVSRIKKCFTDKVHDCILDCEVVAWDINKNQILPFQVLSTRKRKDASESAITVQVCIFIFDLIYLNGESLINKTLEDRRELFSGNFCEVEGEIHFTKYLNTTTFEEVQEFLDESIKGNCEGLMVKTLEVDATYEIAKRSRKWLKLKKDYLNSVGDTLDLVVIGAYLGRGKRTGTYGGFLLACYDTESEQYQTICKLGTGFSDDDLKQHTDFLKTVKIDKAKSYYNYDSSLEPDHWFEPVQIWEIKCADISLSPVHKAAIGIIDPEKGISLRFPRFIRIRDDKPIEDATSAQQVADMYSSQDQIKNNAKQQSINEEEFY